MSRIKTILSIILFVQVAILPCKGFGRIFKKQMVTESIYDDSDVDIDNVTRIQCGLITQKQWYEANTFESRANAFRFFPESGNQCKPGRIRKPFYGDFDEMDSDPAGAEIYVIQDCLPKSDDFNKFDFYFFFSYMDDNKAHEGLVKYPGSNTIQRLEPDVAVGSLHNPPDWNVNLAILDAIPFVMGRSQQFPGFYVNLSGYKGYIQYTTDPVTVTSFSIFTWMYQPYNVWYNGVLNYMDGVCNNRLPKLSFEIGWASRTGKPNLTLQPDGLALQFKHAVNRLSTSMTPTGWNYIGVVYDSPTGVIKYYQNGALHETQTPLAAAYFNAPITGLTCLYLGAGKLGALPGYGSWTSRATTEFYLRAFSDAEAQEAFDQAMTFLGDRNNCSSKSF